MPVVILHHYSLSSCRYGPYFCVVGLMGLKPLVVIIEGKLEKESMTRNSKKFFQDLINQYKEKYAVDKYDYVAP